MANRDLSVTLVLMVAVASMMVASPRAAAQPGVRPDAESQFMPLELVVFPRDPEQSKALAQKLAAGGFLVLGRAPVSGFILIAVAIVGLEDPMCELLKMWPEVAMVERNIRGHSLGRQVASCPHNVMVAGNPCHPSAGGGVLPYPALQLTAPCPTPPAGQPNDPTWCLQWGLRNTGQIVADRSGATPLPNYNGNCWTQPGTPGIDVNVLGAWQFSTGSPLVTVAILDSGIEKCNPDSNQSRFHPNDIALTCIGWEGYNYPCCVGDPGSGDVVCNYGPARDNVGHGTLVASVIGATVNNNLGITGMDQQCKILAARVYGQNGTGSNNVAAVNAARFALALEIIAHNPAYLSVRVINISVWIEDIPQAAFQIQAFENAVNTLAAQNRFVVTGAGNYGIDPLGNYTAETGVPANFPMAITVGAIDNRGWRVAPAYEPDPLGSNSSSVGASMDFMAPGMADAMLVCQSNPCPYPSECAYPTNPCLPNYYSNFRWGTSYAAPKVCAAISLILAEAIEVGVVNPVTWQGLTWQQMYNLLKAGARDQISHGSTPSDPLDTTGHDIYYGWGLIDIEASIREVRRLYCPTCQ